MSRLRSRIHAKVLEGKNSISAAFRLKSPSSSAAEQSNILQPEMSANIFSWVHGWVYPRLRENYRYVPLDSRAVLFHCGRYDKGHGMGWEGLFTRGLEIVQTSGDHFSLLDDLHGEELALRIDHFLEQLRSQEPGDLSRIPGLGEATEVSASEAEIMVEAGV
jgi:thioesterase domain-containing protein